MPDASETVSDLPLRLYREAQLIRRAEEILIEEYHPADEMRCPIHFCVGQEATPAALSQILRPDDWLYSHHRSHGYYLAKGAPLDEMVAEFYGKAAGSNGGLAGSQELSHDGARFFSGTILSGAFALAAGSAFAAKYEKSGAIAVGVIGDGGMEEGIVFETLNLAAVRKLPVLFICENNGYSIHSPLTERSTTSELLERAQAFGVPGARLDGNDAMVLHGELATAVDAMRGGAGPFFAEVMTYRYCGHVGPEDDDHYGYRPASEIEAWKQRDPVTALRVLAEDNGASSNALREIDDAIDDEVHAAIEKAKQAPFPDFDEAIRNNLATDYGIDSIPFIDEPAKFFDPDQPETRLRPY